MSNLPKTSKFPHTILETHKSAKFLIQCIDSTEIGAKQDSGYIWIIHTRNGTAWDHGQRKISLRPFE